MNWDNKRAILYRRVSTEEQKERGYSLADQQDRLEKFCELMHIPIIAQFEDDYSAKTFERPGWRKMEAFIKSNHGAANCLLFTNWSRFSRCENMGTTWTILEKLQKAGIDSQSIEGEIDWHNPESRMLLAINIAAPMIENMRRSSNTIHGMRRSLKQGRFIGKAPFGYIMKRDVADKPILVIDEAKAAVVRNIFEEFINGTPHRKIILNAKEQGFTPKGKSALERVITNHTYAGTILVKTYREEPQQILKGIHEPIISEDIFHLAQRRWQLEFTPYGKVLKEQLPLRGAIYCSCGHLMTGSRSRGKSGKYWWYYHCAKCKGINHNADRAHRELDIILSAISLTPPFIEAVTEEFEIKIKEEINSHRGDVRILKNELQRLEGSLTSLEDKFINNLVGLDTYQRFHPKYKQDIAEKRLQIFKLEENKEDILNLYRQALPMMMNMHRLYAKCDILAKQELIRRIFVGGLIREKEGYRTPVLHKLFNMQSALDAGLYIAPTKAKEGNSEQIPVRVLFGNEIEPLLKFIISLEIAI